MIDANEYQQIVDRVKEKYLSLIEPRFYFKRTAYAQRIYAHIEEEIGAIIVMEDETDINIDVSFQYVLRENKSLWGLQLSMVGLYAAIWRVVEYGKILQVIDATTNALEPIEQRIIETLTKNNIYVLDENSLSMHIPLQLPYIDPQNVRIYQALFTELDILPWA